jgi:hypothetical protein
MKKIYLLIIIALGLFSYESVRAQIYEPEGLNMPGAWNAWENPPVNHLALASSTQVTDGEIYRRSTGLSAHYHTIIHCATAGGDIAPGPFEWLFTSGPSDNAFANKWSAVDVSLNTIQQYTKEGADNNTITVADNKWYTVNFEDSGYGDTRAIFMETSSEPVSLLTVSEPTDVDPDTDIPISITSSAALSAEENVYICYTTDNWVSADAVLASFSGTSGTATIPGQPTNTGVIYFAFTSTMTGITADFGLQSIDINDNAGAYYSFDIGDPPPATITWANLQWPENGEILPEAEFIVYGQVYVFGVTDQDDPSPDIQAWVGYSTSDTDPSTWTDWVAAPYLGNVGDNDEYSVDLGASMSTEGTYYYATRFKYLDQDYVYGGFDGGFWDGTDNVSGVLTVTSNPNPDEINWCNLQYPASGNIEPLEEFLVYGQVYIEDITSGDDPVADLQAWIGYSDTDSDPSGWTNWVAADFGSNQGNNDEYVADLGAEMSTAGTYYYATRFQYQDQDFVYGGYSEAGGDFWNGTDYVSGVLEVTTDPIPDEITWANLQHPASGEIEPLEEFLVYGQAYIDGITSGDDPVADLEAWIGWSSSDSDPATWTNWKQATFSSNQGNNDEYVADLGAEMPTLGTYYYATRFKYQDQEYVYGGYSESGGGFWDGTINVNGVLTVSEDPTPDVIGWCNLHFPGTAAIEPNAELNVFGQVWIENVTSQSDSLTDLQAWIGYSVTNTNPDEWTEWIPAWYDGGDGNNDQYVADLGAMMDTEGTYYYATRFKYQDQDYVYGGFSESGGGFWDGVDYVNGELLVEDGFVPFPVTFVVTDATEIYQNIKLKGEMTNWAPEDMEQDGFDWSVTLDIYPGTYEWGVFEDDGSINGIWLVIGDNLEVTVGEEGNVSGDTTYLITYVGIEELADQMNVYPNPVTDYLWIEHTTQEQMNVKMFNASGKLIQEVISSEKRIQLDFSNLQNAVYFIEVTEGDRQYKTKVLKN